MASSVRGYMKNTLDPLFSKYIRIKEAVKANGYVKCVTCGKVREWDDQMEAGHYVSRDKRATKYDERNVHIQCKSCNSYHGGEIAEYAAYLLSEYGADIITELVQKGREYKKFTLDELKEMAKIYRKRIRDMGYGHVI